MSKRGIYKILLLLLGFVVFSCNSRTYHSISPSIEIIYNDRFQELVKNGVDTIAYCAIVHGNCFGTSVSDTGIFIYVKNGNLNFRSDYKNPLRQNRKTKFSKCTLDDLNFIHTYKDFDLFNDKTKYSSNLCTIRPISYAYLTLRINGITYRDTSNYATLKHCIDLKNPRLKLFTEILNKTCN